MAFADLTQQAQDGLAHRSRRIRNQDGTRRFANARLYGDFVMESNGLEGYAELLEWRRQRALEELAKPANATLAAQVDALVGTDEG